MCVGGCLSRGPSRLHDNYNGAKLPSETKHLMKAPLIHESSPVLINFFSSTSIMRSELDGNDEWIQH